MQKKKYRPCWAVDLFKKKRYPVKLGLGVNPRKVTLTAGAWCESRQVSLTAGDGVNSWQVSFTA